MEETKLAYAAGIFDGEGSVLINHSVKKRLHWLSVRVTNTSLELLEWFKAHFGGSIGKQGAAGPNYGSWRNKPCWYWSISTRQAAKFIFEIEPYLLIKKEQAKLALEFQEKKTISLGGKAVPPEELALRDSYRSQLRALNGRQKRVVEEVALPGWNIFE